jgi:hypothetical protein
MHFSVGMHLLWWIPRLKHIKNSYITNFLPAEVAYAEVAILVLACSDVRHLRNPEWMDDGFQDSWKA